MPKTLRFWLGDLVLALEHIHAKGIVHRDVKPENVLLRADQRIMVIDFGTAKLLRNPIKLGGDNAPDNVGDRRGT